MFRDTTMWKAFVLVLGLFICCAAADYEYYPEQVRLQFAGDGRYVVSYTTGYSATLAKYNLTRKSVNAGPKTQVYFRKCDKCPVEVATGSAHYFTHLKYR